MANPVSVSSARIIVLFLATLALAGCGAAAAPCRVGSAALTMIPFAGHWVATPTDSCAEAIDPSSAGEP
jgi:hypothetical protein